MDKSAFGHPNPRRLRRVQHGRHAPEALVSMRYIGMYSTATQTWLGASDEHAAGRCMLTLPLSTVLVLVLAQSWRLVSLIVARGACQKRQHLLSTVLLLALDNNNNHHHTVPTTIHRHGRRGTAYIHASLPRPMLSALLSLPWPSKRPPRLLVTISPRSLLTHAQFPPGRSGAFYL